MAETILKPEVALTLGCIVGTVILLGIMWVLCMSLAKQWEIIDRKSRKNRP